MLVLLTPFLCHYSLERKYRIEELGLSHSHHHVMRGKRKIRTHILLWQVTGTRKSRRTYGKIRVPFSVSLRWIPLTMAVALAAHSSRLSNALASSGRCVLRRLISYHVNLHLQVGWVTCDNASNNLTMLEAFGRRLNASEARKGCKQWDYKTRHIRYGSFY